MKRVFIFRAVCIFRKNFCATCNPVFCTMMSFVSNFPGLFRKPAAHKTLAQLMHALPSNTIAGKSRVLIFPLLKFWAADHACRESGRGVVFTGGQHYFIP
jgi:hypothetical protein